MEIEEHTHFKDVADKAREQVREQRQEKFEREIAGPGDGLQDTIPSFALRPSSHSEQQYYDYEIVRDEEGRLYGIGTLPNMDDGAEPEALSNRDMEMRPCRA